MSEQKRLTDAVAAHAAALRLYACQLLDDASAADDVVQDALVSLLTLAAPPEQPIPWMYRVIRNAAMDHLRSSERRRRRERRVAESCREWFVPRPASLIDADAAEHALAHLPPEDREIVVLRIWGGLPFAEIAAVVQHSPSTVHTRYVAALSRMRAALEKPCEATTTRSE